LAVERESPSQLVRQVAERLGVKLSEVYLAKYKVSALVKKEFKNLESRID